MKFNKPPLSIPDLIAKLELRGMVITDKKIAHHYLNFIGYYRLSAYCLPFQNENIPDKPFYPGTTFGQVLNLYRFDRELRLLTIDGIERIEVSARSCLVAEMSLLHGAHWYMDSNHFRPGYKHFRLIEKIEGELSIKAHGHPPLKTPAKPHNETFINHYYKKYGDPYLPPAWMTMETLSLGTCSQIFDNLKNQAERKKVASSFLVDEIILTQWLHALTYVRNICAHHARLWNRKMVIKATIAKKHSSFLTSNREFYAVAVIVYDLLKIIAPGTDWANKLESLIKTYLPDLQSMGFVSNWRSDPFWN